MGRGEVGEVVKGSLHSGATNERASPRPQADVGRRLLCAQLGLVLCWRAHSLFFSFFVVSFVLVPTTH